MQAISSLLEKLNDLPSECITVEGMGIIDANGERLGVITITDDGNYGFYATP